MASLPSRLLRAVIEPRRSCGAAPFGAAFMMVLAPVAGRPPSGSVAHARVIAMA
jgi:hypothetical protein